MNSRGRRIARLLVPALSIVMALGLVLTGCQKPPAPVETPKDPVVIGFVGPLTGANSLSGNLGLKAIQLAVEKVNSRGGIQGHPIKVVAENDEFDVAKALAAAQKLVAIDKPHAIIGPYYSSAVISVQTVTEAEKIPHILNCGSARRITMEGQQMIFRLTLSDLWQTEAMSRYAVEKGATRIAILAETGSHGEGTLTGWLQDLKKLNLEPVLVERFENSDMDFGVVLSKARAAQADALVLVPTGAATAARLVQQARRIGFVNTPIYHSSSVSGSMDYIRLAGADAVGAVAPCAFLETNPDPRVQEFVKAFVDRYGENPEGKEPAQGYDIIHILEAYLNKKDSAGTYIFKLGMTAGSLAADRMRIVEALGTVKGWQGYCGIEVNFGPEATPQDRDGIKQPIIAEITADGKWMPVQRQP